MQQLSAGIIGASGYSGIELTRLILGHARARLAFVTSDRWVGQTISSRTALPGELAYVSNEDGVRSAKGCDVVFLATPAETSLELAPKLRANGVRVVDLAHSVQDELLRQVRRKLRRDCGFPREQQQDFGVELFIWEARMRKSIHRNHAMQQF